MMDDTRSKELLINLEKPGSLGRSEFFGFA